MDYLGTSACNPTAFADPKQYDIWDVTEGTISLWDIRFLRTAGELDLAPWNGLTVP